jgi:pyrroloquinoline-quinone synthase
MMTEEAPWTPEEFTQQLMLNEKRYHIFHPFHIAMHDGALTKAQIQGWVLNRFYYQINLPCKDAAILANCPDRAVRRKWIQRLLDQDGDGSAEGGIETWVQLAKACDISEEDLWSLRLVVPGVRFAVDAYVNFAKHAPWYEAACSSLTELFAPKIHQQRLDSWPEHYPWIDQSGLQYFRDRIKKAHRDVEHGLAITLQYFKTREQQARAIEILNFKLDVLWSMLDAISMAYHFKIEEQ